MRTTSQLRQMWGPACKGKTAVLLLHSGARIRVNEATLEAFRAIDAIMQSANYAPRVPDTGGYACRRITNGSSHSLHAYGIAVDYNWNSNPYRADNKLITDMPSKMVTAIKGIKTVKGVQVFRWGGDFKSVKDTMHYEVVASPRELAAGIDWGKIGLAEPDLDRPATWPVLERGAKGPTVRKLQERLAAAGFDCGKVDGVFGAKTEVAVRTFQTSRGLDIDGVCGTQTWTALLTDQPATEAGSSPVKVEFRSEADGSAKIPATCKRASSGKAVRQLQELLNQAGFDCGKVDGKFGPRTETAVKAFQRTRGLEADGIVGRVTWTVLLRG